MPTQRCVHNGIATPRTGKRGRCNQLVDEGTPRPLGAKASGQENPLRFERDPTAQLHREAFFPHRKALNFSFVPEEFSTGDGRVKTAFHIGGYGTIVARRLNHRPAPAKVTLPAKALHEPRAQPASVTVKLVGAESVS